MVIGRGGCGGAGGGGDGGVGATAAATPVAAVVSSFPFALVGLGERHPPVEVCEPRADCLVDFKVLLFMFRMECKAVFSSMFPCIPSFFSTSIFA